MLIIIFPLRRYVKLRESNNRLDHKYLLKIKRQQFLKEFIYFKRRADIECHKCLQGDNRQRGYKQIMIFLLHSDILDKMSLFYMYEQRWGLYVVTTIIAFNNVDYCFRPPRGHFLLFTISTYFQQLALLNHIGRN